VRRVALLLSAVWLTACSDGSAYRQAVAVLVDVSGTYADQKAEVARIVKREVLPAVAPGDTLLLVRIDSQSYDKENLEALVEFDARPSKANAQKLAVAERLDAFAAGAVRSEYTDIPGALMLAAEYLREIPASSRVILVFSDMREELPGGTTRELAATELADIQVIALNVKQLEADNADPQLLRSRLASWEARVRRHGAAGWRQVVDAGQLGGYLAELRS
jgi:hypothetical protein